MNKTEAKIKKLEEIIKETRREREETKKDLVLFTITGRYFGYVIEEAERGISLLKEKIKKEMKK